MITQQYVMSQLDLVSSNKLQSLKKHITNKLHISRYKVLLVYQ